VIGVRVRVLAVGYLGLQAVSVALWWLLLRVPVVHVLFLPPNNDASALHAFAASDLLLLTLGSALAAFLVARRNPWELPLLWLVAGAIDYATIYVIGWAWLANGAWLGVVLMAPAALLTTVFALLIAGERMPLFRHARAASSGWNFAKTLLQIMVFWTVLLAIFPLMLTRLQSALNIPRWTFAGHRPLALALFLLTSAFSLASGINMSQRGEGTPLPLDSPRRLVTTGVYAYVRNPMALMGLLQGASVALWFGSVMVIAYTIFGALLWNFLVRPLEEADLERVFGAAFARYRQAVRCWLPRLTPYRDAD
jgi:protein-S-isoprenylcysteine O-methyltransferase Ste14